VPSARDRRGGGSTPSFLPTIVTVNLATAALYLRGSTTRREKGGAEEKMDPDSGVAFHQVDKSSLTSIAGKSKCIVKL
jgi:hypothetical protein